MEEILVPSIEYSISNRLKDNALFLAERLHASCNSATSLHYLAKVYLWLNKPQHAHQILVACQPSTLLNNAPHNRYLFAQCCVDIDKLQQAEAILTLPSSSVSANSLSIYGLPDRVWTEHELQLMKDLPSDDNQQYQHHLRDSADDGLTSASGKFDDIDADLLHHIPNGASGLYLMGVICRYAKLQYNTTQHNTTQHNTTQHNTTQHNEYQMLSDRCIVLSRTCWFVWSLMPTTLYSIVETNNLNELAVSLSERY
jgi:hypothetical protein